MAEGPVAIQSEHPGGDSGSSGRKCGSCAFRPNNTASPVVARLRVAASFGKPINQPEFLPDLTFDKDPPSAIASRASVVIGTAGCIT